MFPKIDLALLSEWDTLKKHFQEENFLLRDLFQKDSKRFQKFTLEHDGILFDYSKNLIQEETMVMLLRLAKACQLAPAIEAYFQGEKINETEGRAVLHTALRSSSTAPLMLDGEDIRKKIRTVNSRMKIFTRQVISGEYKGYSGKPITDVVNIGIGGSDLGPAMVTEALQVYSTRLNMHFVSNIDGIHLGETLKKLNPEQTLFIVASKTFTTQETMTNAATAKSWLLSHFVDEESVSKHFVALSTNTKATESFGILPDNQFEFWDWIGGRFSLWSAIGLSIMLGIGVENYEKLLLGAENIDLHFRNTPFEKNIPVIMGVLGIWYRNFFNTETYAILPYAQSLDKFPEYLQQADMESNGKSINRIGQKVQYNTGAVIWGKPGTNGQHAFYQLIHQGTSLVPSDFIGYIEPLFPLQEHHEKLMANFFAQTEALAFGKTQAELQSEGVLQSLIPHKSFEGNKPTNTLLFRQLSPYSLGQLIAIYEHKIFVQGVIWNIFSYDQFGVELGKVLAGEILKEIKAGKRVSKHDDSTNGLINYFIKNKNINHG